jgi:diadenosine tetraphosphatase ApaH/serine/threonine PP2A family protein phosphatase
MLEMSGAAALGILHARKQMSLREAQFLAHLPLTAEFDNVQLVHASLCRPNNWTYLMREPEMREHFAAQSAPIAFCGHTHIPAAVQMQNNDVHLLGFHGTVQLPANSKVLVNVGSVGQPRDRSSEACYVLYDRGAHTIEFRRVKYDVSAAQRRIGEAGLPKITGERLAMGK